MTAVSVVMPVRNEERSVAGAITSVLRQSETDLELLVVDGGSTDATLREVEQIAAVEPRVRVLHNPQRTIPHALNVGLASARGRYLARVDAHAAVNDTYLERGVAALDADPAVAAVGGRRIGVAATPSGVAAATALSSRFGVGDSINHYSLVAQDTDHASFGVFRVDVLRSVGGWDVNLPVNEDVDIDHRILAAGHRIRFDPQMCIYWHVRESLPALGRQYRRYGRGKAAMVHKNGRGAIRIRHLAPPTLVLGLTGAALATAGGLWPVGLLVAVPYAVAVAGATAATLRSGAPVPHPDGAVTARQGRLG
jgi:succinoglycan biosynthesis protein ExoA